MSLRAGLTGLLILDFCDVTVPGRWGWADGEGEVDHVQEAGTYSIDYDGSQLPSGVYFYQVRVGNDVSVERKMVLIR